MMPLRQEGKRKTEVCVQAKRTSGSPCGADVTQAEGWIGPSSKETSQQSPGLHTVSLKLP